MGWPTTEPGQYMRFMIVASLLILTPGHAAGQSFECLGHFNDEAPSSGAMGVSADGRVAVGESKIPPGGANAFRWEGGVITNLGSLPGGFPMSLGLGVSLRSKARSTTSSSWPHA